VADANESNSRERQNTTDTNNQGWTTSETGRESIQSKDRETLSSNTGQSGSDVANTSGSRSEIRISEERYREEGNTKKFNNDSDRYRGWQRENNWAVEPNVGRVAYGVPKRVDRLKCLGNSLVPQIPYYIGKVILEVMSGKTN
jgi:DNA (cytosine-5)-methyltransferase 1